MLLLHQSILIYDLRFIIKKIYDLRLIHGNVRNSDKVVLLLLQSFQILIESGVYI